MLSNWLIAQLYNYTWCIHDPAVRQLMPGLGHCTCIGLHTRKLPRERGTSITTDWWIAEQRTVALSTLLHERGATNRVRTNHMQQLAIAASVLHVALPPPPTTLCARSYAAVHVRTWSDMICPDRRRDCGQCLSADAARCIEHHVAPLSCVYVSSDSLSMVRKIAERLRSRGHWVVGEQDLFGKGSVAWHFVHDGSNMTMAIANWLMIAHAEVRVGTGGSTFSQSAMMLRPKNRDVSIDTSCPSQVATSGAPLLRFEAREGVIERSTATSYLKSMGYRAYHRASLRVRSHAVLPHQRCAHWSGAR